MSDTGSKITRPKKRLLTLFMNIESEAIRNIVSDVVAIESLNRSAKRFPLGKVREVVDREARFQEQQTS